MYRAEGEGEGEDEGLATDEEETNSQELSPDNVDGA